LSHGQTDLRLIRLDGFQNLFDNLGMQDFARMKWNDNPESVFSINAMIAFTPQQLKTCF
jgi:hypothetical protein